MKIKVGDKALVITGSYKGKEGKVISILKDQNRVVLEGINIVKKHVKPNGQNETGGIQEVEAPIHISNIKVIDKAEKKETTKKVKKETTEKKQAPKKKTTKKEESK